MVQPKITLYTSPAPNGQKVTIALEILNIPYEVKLVDISANEHKEDWYLKINPNGRLPAIVDHSNNDFAVFESGAILLYLANKHDPENKLWPKDSDAKSEVTQWLMFQMSGIGPYIGQLAHFGIFAGEKIDYAIKRYSEEAKRLHSVIESRLEGRDYLAADQLTIADIATFPWIAVAHFYGVNLKDYPNTKRWVSKLDSIPEVVKGLDFNGENSARISRKSPEVIKKLVGEANEKLFGKVEA
ncbi:glutathione S-transferase family protein [Conidiobolus coronatus NRRL 28638]|uniref:Glutathione S-transferase family protein n=1 Tax=Conidiobolus coronatus (strain ATCC 28846 / CBS 209.66 / NRRL 28638) TaxID=796925 RepID=A0A137PDQ1_CONC2|nr:glutathione S-transferase family protein [Conidiobolus coronatus NRRL 28638]|eukprot:KXN73129.1 glutathione S-transferase family protein [Conidiobolus coronatus NRRL 28638]